MNKNLTKYIVGPVSLTPREAALALSACAFGAAACLMTGVVVGMLISPRKNVTIGSHNGCYNGDFPGKTCKNPIEEKNEE